MANTNSAVSKIEDITRGVQDGFSNLTTQARLLHSFFRQEPFVTWYFEDEQKIFDQLVNFSIVPAATSTAYRLMDKRKDVLSLNRLIHMKDDRQILQNNFDRIYCSDGFKQILTHRHEYYAHRGETSGPRRQLEEAGKTVSLNRQRFLDVLIEVGAITTSTLMATPDTQSMAHLTNTAEHDGSAKELVIRLFKGRNARPGEWDELTHSQAERSLF